MCWHSPGQALYQSREGLVSPNLPARPAQAGLLTGRRRAACAAKKLSCASLTCSSRSLAVGSVAWHCRQRAGKHSSEWRSGSTQASQALQFPSPKPALSSCEQHHLLMGPLAISAPASTRTAGAPHMHSKPTNALPCCYTSDTPLAIQCGYQCHSVSPASTRTAGAPAQRRPPAQPPCSAACARPEQWPPLPAHGRRNTWEGELDWAAVSGSLWPRCIA